jgi:hypothetical protein
MAGNTEVQAKDWLLGWAPKKRLPTVSMVVKKVVWEGQ